MSYGSLQRSVEERKSTVNRIRGKKRPKRAYIDFRLNLRKQQQKKKKWRKKVG